MPADPCLRCGRANCPTLTVSCAVPKCYGCQKEREECAAFAHDRDARALTEALAWRARVEPLIEAVRTGRAALLDDGHDDEIDADNRFIESVDALLAAAKPEGT